MGFLNRTGAEIGYSFDFKNAIKSVFIIEKMFTNRKCPALHGLSFGRMRAQGTGPLRPLFRAGSLAEAGGRPRGRAGHDARAAGKRDGGRGGGGGGGGKGLCGHGWRGRIRFLSR